MTQTGQVRTSWHQDSRSTGVSGSDLTMPSTSTYVLLFIAPVASFVNIISLTFLASLEPNLRLSRTQECSPQQYTVLVSSIPLEQESLTGCNSWNKKPTNRTGN